MAFVLPSGRGGQGLAVGVTLLAVLLTWLGVIAPVMEWHTDRDETLRRQRALAHRMAALVETLPALRKVAADTAGNGPKPGTLLAGATDAVAAAALQQKLDELAATSGVRIGSEEILPAQAAGEFRAIAVRVTLTAPFQALVALLEALAQAEMPMVADEMQLRGPQNANRDSDLPVDARFTVTAYRSGGSETR
jgi:general secretion pathway protein M